jgi:hypothetical protein
VKRETERSREGETEGATVGGEAMDSASAANINSGAEDKADVAQAAAPERDAEAAKETAKESEKEAGKETEKETADGVSVREARPDLSEIEADAIKHLHMLLAQVCMSLARARSLARSLSRALSVTHC